MIKGCFKFLSLKKNFKNKVFYFHEYRTILFAYHIIPHFIILSYHLSENRCDGAEISLSFCYTTTTFKQVNYCPLCIPYATRTHFLLCCTGYWLVCHVLPLYDQCTKWFDQLTAHLFAALLASSNSFSSQRSQAYQSGHNKQTSYNNNSKQRNSYPLSVPLDR